MASRSGRFGGLPDSPTFGWPVGVRPAGRATRRNNAGSWYQSTPPSAQSRNRASILGHQRMLRSSGVPRRNEVSSLTPVAQEHLATMFQIRRTAVLAPRLPFVWTLRTPICGP